LLNSLRILPSIKEFNDPELDNMVYEAQAIGKAENNPKKMEFLNASINFSSFLTSFS